MHKCFGFAFFSLQILIFRLLSMALVKKYMCMDAVKLLSGLPTEKRLRACSCKNPPDDIILVSSDCSY